MSYMVFLPQEGKRNCQSEFAMGLSGRPAEICALSLLFTLALIVYFLDHSLIIHLKQMNPEHNRVQVVSAIVGIQHMSPEALPDRAFY